VAGCTGSTSEQVVAGLYGLPEDALLDMGDFAGALLKYPAGGIRCATTIAGRFASCPSCGRALDLQLGPSQVDVAMLATLAESAGAPAEVVARVRPRTRRWTRGPVPRAR